MKISEQWLRELVNPPVDTATLAKQLTAQGLEVEGVFPVASALDFVVVGEVLEVKPHPTADKLSICQVNIGQKASVQIVCGAKVISGIKVPVALPNAKLANNLVIKESVIREVKSSGMLCAKEELGLEDKSDSLMMLPASAKVGQSITDYLNLNDKIIELGLTPNRGDCASVIGVARELGLSNKLAVKDIDIIPFKATSNERIAVKVL